MLNGYIVNNVLVWVYRLNQWIHVCLPKEKCALCRCAPNSVEPSIDAFAVSKAETRRCQNNHTNQS